MTSTDHARALSDEQLIALTLNGDSDAFGVLVSRHLNRVHRFVCFTLKARRAEADDLTQDVFLQAFRGIHTFSGRSSVRTWLFGIAKNVCRQRSAVFARDLRSDDGQSVLQIPDSRPSVHSVLEDKERRAALKDAINLLSPVQRAVVFLRDVDGLSYDDIARVLDVPLGTVRSRLHNARAALAVSLRREQQ